MKKFKLVFLLVALLFVVTACSCTTTKSFTYKVETGDKIKIGLKTGDGYNIKSDLPFTITKNGDVLSQGTFIKIEYYDQYVNNAKNDTSSTILEENSKNNITYVFYNYNNEEYNYIIKFDNSNTALIIGNNVSEASAREVFNRLILEKK